MFHTIEFAAEVIIDLEVAPNKPLEKECIQKGARVKVELKPYALETKSGMVEVADLYFPDGRITRRVPFAKFTLVDL